MAISVKDIQEKEFATVAENAYDAIQVDDFLDELAEQLGATMRENLALNNQVKELQAALAAAEAAKEEAEKKAPDYNTSAYIKNMETAMRESLISAQRIADETVAEANKKAQQTIEDANVQAEKAVADANEHAKSITDAAVKAVAEMQAESNRLHAVVDAYRTNFKKMLDEQLAALKAGEALLK